MWASNDPIWSLLNAANLHWSYAGDDTARGNAQLLTTVDETLAGNLNSLLAGNLAPSQEIVSRVHSLQALDAYLRRQGSGQLAPDAIEHANYGPAGPGDQAVVDAFSKTKSVAGQVGVGLIVAAIGAWLFGS